LGAQSTFKALTENRGGTAPAGSLYVGIDAGRRHHVVAAIVQERMENGSWERAGAHRISTNGQGFRELLAWLQDSGHPPSRVRIGCEPTGGWYAETVAAWLARHGYEIWWLQNWAVHERRQLAIGKQTKTDALDARLIARLLYEREFHGQDKGFLNGGPRSIDALRLLVRNRVRLIEQRTRHRLQLTAIEDVLFPELKDYFRSSISSSAVRHLLEAFPTPQAIVAATPDAIYEVLVRQGRARIHAARIGELQRLASESAGLVVGIEPILHAQGWILRQLHAVDDQIEDVERSTANALEAWPAEQRAVLESFPCMSLMRQAVLFSAIGDVVGFRNDGQLRKLLGWYPEARESGTSLSKHQLGNSGNRLGRREVWFWAMQLIAPRQQATPFALYYRRLRKRGMPGHAAVGHLAGKLISVLFFCLRSGRRTTRCSMRVLSASATLDNCLRLRPQIRMWRAAASSHQANASRKRTFRADYRPLTEMSASVTARGHLIDCFLSPARSPAHY
jgi:transposase